MVIVSSEKRQLLLQTQLKEAREEAAELLELLGWEQYKLAGGKIRKKKNKKKKKVRKKASNKMKLDHIDGLEIL